MKRTHRSVRVDPELLATVEELTRQHLVPVGFTDQVWTRSNGMRWVEVQAEPMEPSGWRLMVPLVDLQDAPDAPPLVVTLDEVRARVHLLTSAPDDDLGEPAGSLPVEDVEVLQAAAERLITG